MLKEYPKVFNKYEQSKKKLALKYTVPLFINTFTFKKIPSYFKTLIPWNRQTLRQTKKEY